MHIQSTVRSNSYYDSLVLMQLSAKLLKQPGVQHAAVMMGTEENKHSIGNEDLITDNVRTARPNDLVIVVAADDSDAASAAIDHALTYLDEGQTGVAATTMSYRTLDGAIRNTPGANLVSISLPGKYAAEEAERALEAGLHVFLFSDNVPIDEEIALKARAARNNVLCMGADCGTAILGGAALGFANEVQRGSIGVVGASGTGIQEVTSLIHRLGAGISHAIGTGTHDVSERVGGQTLCAGIEWFAADADTDVIVIVSKPSAPTVTQKVQSLISECDKPVIVNLLGSSGDELQGDTVAVAETLEDAAVLAVAASTARSVNAVRASLYTRDQLERLIKEQHARLTDIQQYFRGLFAGGTFTNESCLLLRRHLPNSDDIFGNVSLPGVSPLDDPMTSQAHSCVDMGEDVFTVGKPHPILAPSLRRDRILQEAHDPETGIILLDIVIGHGAHESPAPEFAEYIEEATAIAAHDGRHLPIIVSVCGVDTDAQNRAEQVEILQEGGAIVAPTNSAATRIAIGILTGNLPSVSPAPAPPATGAPPDTGAAPFTLPARANVINVGLVAFADSLEAQGVPVTHVDFHPPAGGDEKMAGLLADML